VIMTLAYLISLPLSVWLLATLCALIDEPNPIYPLLRLIASICVILILLMATDRTLATPLLYAFGTVVVLHLLGFWLLRKISIGVPIYEAVPPPAATTSDEHDTQRG